MTECPVNQALGMGGWTDLCDGRLFELEPGTGSFVELADDTGDWTGWRIAWDAVRFVGVPQDMLEE